MIGPAYTWFGGLSDEQRELISAHLNLVTKARSLWDSATQLAVNQDQHTEAYATIDRELEEMITEIQSLADRLRASGIGMSRPPWEREDDEE